MRLLIIEDDRESADYLVKAFREVGYVADLAGDGEEGLALADSGDYDVLVIDRMLPKRDGLSLIGSLRARSHGPQVPPIAGQKDPSPEAGSNPHRPSRLLLFFLSGISRQAPARRPGCAGL